MLVLFLFLAFMCFVVSYLVFSFYLHAKYTDKQAYMEKGQLVDDKKTMLGAFIFCISFSIIFLLIITMVSSTVGMEDFWIAIVLYLLVSYITSLLTARQQKKKYQRNDFKRLNRNSLILLIITFIFLSVTDDSIETSSSESTAGEAVEQTEEVDEEETDQAALEKEKEAEEQAAAEKEEQAQAEKEKAEKEQAAKEQAAKEKAEKEKQERIAQEKKEKEQAEKERLEKEKAEQEKAEKAKAEEEAKQNGLIPVTLYRVVDGDTVDVFDENGEVIKLRLLLIDTPETVHPRKPVEPFGPEASARLTELLNSGEQLSIEYDDGAKTDHYDRHLVYLYVGDTSVHEILLEEGLAKVGYIYEQQRYLDDFRAKEQIAKDQQIGIWSLPGYVNEAGEGFNSESETESTVENESSTPDNSQTSGSGAVNTAPKTGGVEFFNNCTELNAVYPDGVSSAHAAYQSKMDRDKDNWACEK